MDGQFLLVLVLLLGASGLCGQGLGPRGPLEEPPEEKPPEEKPPEEEPPEEDGVLVLSRQTLGQALQEHPALLVEFCECRASMAGDPQGPPGCSASPSLCSWGSIRALGQSWAWGPASRWGGTGAGGIQSVSPRLFREGPASTQAGVVQPIHRQEPLPAGRPPQADGGSWPHGWPRKIHPKPTLGTVLATAVPLGGPQGVWPPVLGLWPRLRWAPDEEGVDWTCCSLPDLKRGAGPEVGRLWPGWGRGCGGGGEGLGHSWVCPPDALWCGHCRALAPEYSKAAALLAAESARVTLAKVDGPAEPELAEEFAVTEYPTLKFFREGNRTHPEEYTGAGRARGRARGRAGGRGWASAEGSLRRPPGGRGHRRVAAAAGGAQRQAAGGRGGRSRTHGHPGRGSRRLLPGALRAGAGPGSRVWARRPHRPGPLRTCRTGTWLPSWAWPRMPWT